eukprot:CAMPEP_0116893470 /NCGR_PEP_ID=MMETSP0467-20121206/3445_1 /TAXON_ID=283647 /ORGANISM="Mesodinium pulex, Strain SPMC105" /LENGTH=60 /DNA_ID=CAMNT_0004563135 /DNA_START=120 /DNA_END=302 /DNA_ORIENTATION=-
MTAKATLIEQSQVPHHNIDSVDSALSRNSNVQTYTANSIKIVSDIFSRNKVPAIVGGSMN